MSVDAEAGGEHLCPVCGEPFDKIYRSGYRIGVEDSEVCTGPRSVLYVHEEGAARYKQ